VRRVDLQFRIIGCLFLSFAPDFPESNEYQANEGQCDQADRIEPVKLADRSL
jgi:hypothetical protein